MRWGGGGVLRRAGKLESLEMELVKNGRYCVDDMKGIN